MNKRWREEVRKRKFQEIHDKEGSQGHGKKIATGRGGVCQKREKLVHFNVFQVDRFF